jgi:hypothetical protein
MLGLERSEQNYLTIINKFYLPQGQVGFNTGSKKLPPNNFTHMNIPSKFVHGHT